MGDRPVAVTNTTTPPPGPVPGPCPGRPAWRRPGRSSLLPHRGRSGAWVFVVGRKRPHHRQSESDAAWRGPSSRWPADTRTAGRASARRTDEAHRAPSSAMGRCRFFGARLADPTPAPKRSPRASAQAPGRRRGTDAWALVRGSVPASGLHPRRRPSASVHTHMGVLMATSRPHRRARPGSSQLRQWRRRWRPGRTAQDHR